MIFNALPATVRTVAGKALKIIKIGGFSAFHHLSPYKKTLRAEDRLAMVHPYSWGRIA
jgi:hypothetical protein